MGFTHLWVQTPDTKTNSIDGVTLKQPLILASKSPRRAQLLKEAGIPFTVVLSDVDESQFNAQGLSADALARQLALAKAQAVALKHTHRLVLGADTLVAWQGEIIGKPADAADAETIVRKIFSSPHEVITGVALVRIQDSTEVVRSDITTVYPRPLTDSDIKDHIDEGTWKDKAGAYAIQEGGDRFIQKLDGSLSNVIGLPMELLGELMGSVC